MYLTSAFLLSINIEVKKKIITEMKIEIKTEFILRLKAEIKISLKLRKKNYTVNRFLKY